MVFDLDCYQITTLINESLLNRTPIALNISTPHHSNVVTDSLFNNNDTSQNVGNFILVVLSTVLILSCFFIYAITKGTWNTSFPKYTSNDFVDEEGANHQTILSMKRM